MICKAGAPAAGSKRYFLRLWWVWHGIVFQTLPAGCVYPSRLASSRPSWIYWWMVRQLAARRLPTSIGWHPALSRSWIRVMRRVAEQVELWDLTMVAGKTNVSDPIRRTGSPARQAWASPSTSTVLRCVDVQMPSALRWQRNSHRNLSIVGNSSARWLARRATTADPSR